MNATFTKKEFYTEICRFREMFGNKEWWNKPLEIREQCVRGLSHMYLNVVNDDGSFPSNEQLKEYANVFQNTLNEYHHRGAISGKET